MPTCCPHNPLPALRQPAAGGARTAPGAHPACTGRLTGSPGLQVAGVEMSAPTGNCSDGPCVRRTVLMHLFVSAQAGGGRRMSRRFWLACSCSCPRRRLVRARPHPHPHDR